MSVTPKPAICRGICEGNGRGQEREVGWGGDASVAACTSGLWRPCPRRSAKAKRFRPPRLATVRHTAGKVNLREMSLYRECIGPDCRQSASIYGNGDANKPGCLPRALLISSRRLTFSFLCSKPPFNDSAFFFIICCISYTWDLPLNRFSSLLSHETFNEMIDALKGQAFFLFPDFGCFIVSFIWNLWRCLTKSDLIPRC